MKVKAFITHKLSEKYSDCQDYFVIDKDSRAIAVSDGMSQSVFPGWWAEELTKKFVSISNSENITDYMAELQKIWRHRVDEYIETSKKAGKNPWRLENCIAERKGAGATLCGIRFKSNKWEGFVLGDTCLIEIDSSNHLARLYPKQENGFGNHPDYFDSMKEGKGEPVSISGELSADKKLLIVSDPFAELIYLNSLEKSEDKIIERMFQVSSHEEFEQLVDDLRLNEKMHNDDSTMVCVEFDGDENFNIDTEDKLADLIEKEKEEVKIGEPIDEEKKEFVIEITNTEETIKEDTLSEIERLRIVNGKLEEENNKLRLIINQVKAYIENALVIKFENNKDFKNWRQQFKNKVLDFLKI